MDIILEQFGGTFPLAWSERRQCPFSTFIISLCFPESEERDLCVRYTLCIIITAAINTSLGRDDIFQRIIFPSRKSRGEKREAEIHCENHHRPAEEYMYKISEFEHDYFPQIRSDGDGEHDGRILSLKMHCFQIKTSFHTFNFTSF